jgi:aminoglycoside phosphotransferase family enzyme/gluconate kinase
LHLYIRFDRLINISDSRHPRQQSAKGITRVELPKLAVSPVLSATVAPNELIRALQNPALYDHPIKDFSLIETHISWVLLTGVFAYKIKKPVNFGFVDFSTLRKRKYFCAEELRLNRRFAPELYLQVIAIKGSAAQPRLSGGGKTIEYAVKMREFPQHCLLSVHATERRLEPAHIDSIADVIASFHALAERAEPNSTYGAVDIILKWGRENFDNIESVTPASDLPKYFEALMSWCTKAGKQNLRVMNERQSRGFIRECHGDLHLGNMALIEGNITLFDCIEFNPELRWIDTISEVAFVAMDLQARGYSGFAWQFINRYLQASGDYAGIALLRYYFVYRALVRAKVAALGVMQESSDTSHGTQKYREAIGYLDLAHRWSSDDRPAIIIMHGLSGSGKSTLARHIVEALGAIQIRSDVERKRLFDLNPEDHSGSSLEQGIYTQGATKRTYDRLAELTKVVVQAGFTTIVDASFLKKSDRDQFKRLAQACYAPYIVISCEAPEGVLRERIRHRSETQRDPSEANLSVLQHQLQSQEPLTMDEQTQTNAITCSRPALSSEQLRTLERMITDSDLS